ncbi:MAG TPA: PVC-type heme-binding CxxCH protein [Vicinamibacterales bacterium]
MATISRRSCCGAIVLALLALQGRAATEQAIVETGPPYSPARALDTFRIADGFQIELFAAEPLVESPVAMEIDERGRLFVVEMPGYPLDVSGSGRVTLLADTNADGKPDRRTVFADGLRLPTGVMRWKQGVIVTDSPQVWYLEDSDGDGRADVKRELLTGFALSNPQHTTNTPIYGLDNWIYLANEGPVRTTRYQDVFGDPGAEVRFPDRPNGPRLPPDADGRNVRFRPESGELEMLSSRSQFGQTFDPWGHHFLVTNSRHLIHEVIAARYLTRNPSLVVPSVVEQVPDYRQPAALFPITQNPEFQLLTDVGVMTSACGLTYYLADLFPPEYRAAAFVAEGAHNLVHVASVRDHGASFRARRMFDGREFLASTDAWFRPVNFYVGPDGALYLIDYYRKILEHPEWMDDATAKSQEVYAGRDRGRIYRITPKGTAPPSWLGRVMLATASSTELVSTLAHPNIWWRRHAQRMLLDRRPDKIAGALATVAASSESAVGRVHALWTSEGLGVLDKETLGRALKDATPGVRENAIRIAELRLPAMPSLEAALVGMAKDPDPKVRFQLLLTLGNLDTAHARAARTTLLFDNVEDEWLQIAALSAKSANHGALLRTAVMRFQNHETPGARTLFARLGTMSGAASEPAAAREAVRLTAPSRGSSADWWRAAVLDGLATGIRGDRRRAPDLDPERALVATLLFERERPPVRRAALHLLETIGLPAGPAAVEIEEKARQIVANPLSDADASADAIRLLALRGLDRYQTVLVSILRRPEPAAVQIAAIRALAEPKGDEIVAGFIDLWDGWTPAVRGEAVRALAREPGRIRVLLDAIAAGKIGVSEIEWPLRVRMMMLDDEPLRARARAIFGQPASAAAEAIEKYRAAATMTGSVDRGRGVFARACASCHQYRGANGSRFGPDLGEVRGRLPIDLLHDILQPNRSIADGYELYAVELTDGTSTSGVISGETPTSVTLRLPGGSETTIARGRIASMRIAPLSAMPDGLGASLDLQSMADLIAFIKGGQ